MNLIRALEDDMRRKAGISLDWYDVMVHLSESPGGLCRMSDLAGSLPRPRRRAFLHGCARTRRAGTTRERVHADRAGCLGRSRRCERGDRNLNVWLW